MAICRPGMASRTNRAVTSLMRPVPFVMTTNCTTEMIAKRITPTASEPAETNVLNAQITLPAAYWACSRLRPFSPAVRISRVVAMFSTRRNSVAPSSTDGNTLNSSGLRTWITVISTTADRARFATSSRLTTSAGKGTSTTKIIAAAATGKSSPRCRASARNAD